MHRSLDAMSRFEVMQEKLQTKMQGLQEKYRKEEEDKCTFTPNIGSSKLYPRKGSGPYRGYLTGRSSQRDRLGSLRSARSRPYRDQKQVLVSMQSLPDLKAPQTIEYDKVADKLEAKDNKYFSNKEYLERIKEIK